MQRNAYRQCTEMHRLHATKKWLIELNVQGLRIMSQSKERGGSMAKNDVILLDGILDERKASETLDRGELFELFAFEQILKSFDLTREEIEVGWVDGENDGGIDGFFTFINGILVQKDTKIFPKKGGELEIWIISCKHKDSFRQDPLNTIFPTIEELLNFTLGKEDFSGKYSDNLLAARAIAVNAYHKAASGLPSVNFRFVYACRGDSVEVAENIQARGNQIKRIVNENFSAASVTLDYQGAAELIDLHRQSRVVLELPYSEQLSAVGGAYILLVDLEAYSNFVTDEHGNLKRYLFDSNVRDYLGTTRVNVDIEESLNSANGPDFWWLNNGVTILATSSIPLGKTGIGTSIQLHDVQIVNGLQTTQSIHQHFRQGGKSLDRKVLVKVVVSDDVAVRDKIIQATNNQNPVELAALNATDRIQRDIEQILERHDWYYERRKNYYKNIGKPIERFVTPLSLAVAVTAILKRSPNVAGSLRSKFMRNQASYESVFNNAIPITIWPKLAEFIKWTEIGMGRSVPIMRSSRSRALRTWRGAVALCSVAEINKKFMLTYDELLATDLQEVSSDRADIIFTELQQLAVSGRDERAKMKSKLSLVDWACIKFGEAHGIADTATIGRWRLSGSDDSTSHGVSPELIDAVDAVLPSQPWPAKIRNQVAAILGVSRGEVFRAMEALQESGRRHRQKGAVVVDQNDVIIEIDQTRNDGRFQIGAKYSTRPLNRSIEKETTRSGE